MKTIELTVEGMTCGSCVKHVKQALQAVPGVVHVEVDLLSGRAKVQGDLQVGSTSLIAALQPSLLLRLQLPSPGVHRSLETQVAAVAANLKIHNHFGVISMRKLFILLISVFVLTLSGCGYNTFQSTDEQIKASWSEVLNQYQRRADLIPNLVSTVKGETKFEQDTLIKVVEARAKATSIQVNSELINDPAAFAKFQQAQSQLSGALSRLLVVSENYPNLKANQAFRDLQAQLEGTENRITVARNRYIKAVQEYNVTVRSFPSNLTAMVFGYKEKANFTVENEKEITKPPSVNFDSAPAANQSSTPGITK
jgi:LemA protein